MAKVCVLGTGAMGSRMVLNLLERGHDVAVWNRTRSKADKLVSHGAKVFDTPLIAVEGAEYVVTMLRDDEASKKVWLDHDTGAAAGMSRDAIAIESSTVSLDWIQSLSAALAERKLDFLDAPVSGTLPHVENRQLTYFIGGDEVVFKRAREIFNSLGGSSVRYAGSSGSGMAVKLATNLMLGLQVVGMAEVIALLRQSGTDADRAMDMIGDTPVCSQAAKAAASSMLERQFDPMFTVELLSKDFDYLQKAARGLDLPLTASAHAMVNRAIKDGYGKDNMTAVTRLYDKPS